MEPLVSIIIPVYNSERYVGDAINSALQQTYQNKEIIVLVDGGSEDNSLSVIKSYLPKVNIHQHSHVKIGAARNLGVKNSTGDFIAFLDSDDLWERDKLTLQMKEFSDDPDLEVCFGYFKSFLSPDLEDEMKLKRHCPSEAQPGHLASTTIIKCNVFEKVGLFDEEFKLSDFVGWYTRAKMMNITMKTIPQTVSNRRIHSSNTGIRERKARVEYLRIFKNSIDQRRKEQRSKLQ